MGKMRYKENIENTSGKFPYNQALLIKAALSDSMTADVYVDKEKEFCLFNE